MDFRGPPLPVWASLRPGSRENAVRANLVTLLDDLPTLIRKVSGGMPWMKNVVFNVFLEQGQRADDADLARNAALNIGRQSPPP
jgi:hypothetical protein